ncbi:MAG: DUF5615 family PIN-like protein [bacterium]|nr:DUF5615 family PIN-like protein [bacterium]
MRLLLDEMHAPRVAARLRERGHDAVAVKERAELTGMSDEDLLRAATADQRAVVTENVKDFAPLHQHIAAAGQNHAGLIFTHPRRFSRSAPHHVQVLADALGAFLVEHGPRLEEVGAFVWWLEPVGRYAPSREWRRGASFRSGFGRSRLAASIPGR